MIKRLKISHMARWFANEPVWKTSSMKLSIPEFQCINFNLNTMKTVSLQISLLTIKLTKT